MLAAILWTSPGSSVDYGQENWPKLGSEYLETFRAFEKKTTLEQLSYHIGHERERIDVFIRRQQIPHAPFDTEIEGLLERLGCTKIPERIFGPFMEYKERHGPRKRMQ